jgi:alpha-D-ribose 1-methylphosphonate 5-phosphate C-P lyase
MVAITDVAITENVLGTHTIKEITDDNLVLFDDGNVMLLCNDTEFNKWKVGETAWVHYDEVTAKLID